MTKPMSKEEIARDRARYARPKLPDPDEARRESAERWEAFRRDLLSRAEGPGPDWLEIARDLGRQFRGKGEGKPVIRDHRRAG